MSRYISMQLQEQEYYQKNQEQRKFIHTFRLMKWVRTYFTESGYIYKDDRIRIMSGEEEGIFGWISANYLLSKALVIY